MSAYYELLDNPMEILYRLCKNELQLLDEFVKAGPNAYIVRKQRKTPYKLQKFYLVLTYRDDAHGEWHMLMPDSVRKALTPYYKFYLDHALQGMHAPSPKEMRIRAALEDFIGGKGDN